MRKGPRMAQAKALTRTARPAASLKERGLADEKGPKGMVWKRLVVAFFFFRDS